MFTAYAGYSALQGVEYCSEGNDCGVSEYTGKATFDSYKASYNYYNNLGLTQESAGIVSEGTLTELQQKNLERFMKKIPSNAKNSVTFTIKKNGDALFTAKSPARNIPNSYAEYSKEVNPLGETIRMDKTTFAPDGSIVHIKNKL